METPTKEYRLRRIRAQRRLMKALHEVGALHEAWYVVDIELAKRERALLDEICREQVQRVVA